jgi:hypothetical protein
VLNELQKHFRGRGFDEYKIYILERSFPKDNYTPGR